MFRVEAARLGRYRESLIRESILSRCFRLGAVLNARCDKRSARFPPPPTPSRASVISEEREREKEIADDDSVSNFPCNRFPERERRGGKINAFARERIPPRFCVSLSPRINCNVYLTVQFNEKHTYSSGTRINRRECANIWWM